MEAEIFTDWSHSDEWPEATPAVLEELSARMPVLMEEFRRVVDRGWPTK
jgi:hypothetical protein